MSQNKAGNGARLSAVPNGPTEGRISRPSLRAPAQGTGLDGGKWVVDRPLGKGGMGVVVLAHHAVLRHQVAIKILPTEVVEGLVNANAQAEAKKRLLREARILASAQSPFVVRVWDYFEDVEGLCLVMPYMDQGDLGSLLEKTPRVPVHEVARYLAGIADGLDYLHGKGVIHRDIKPENILLEQVAGRLEPRIADAGVAAVTRGNALNITHTTSTGCGLFGTPFYISPEVVNLEHTDARSDIYSLGVVVYQMLAGRVPFDAPGLELVLRQHRDDPPPPITKFLPTFPVEVERVVLKALSKNPDNRYQTAGAFSEAFSAALERSGYRERSLSETLDVNADTVHASTPPAERISAPPTPQTEAFALERRRRRTTPVRGSTIHPKPTSRWVVAPLALGALLLGGFGWWFLSAPPPVADNAADTAPEAQQGAPVAVPEEPPVVPAPMAVAEAPLPLPRPAPAVASPRDAAECTSAVLGPLATSLERRAACRRYCAASAPTDQVRIKAVRRGYCHEVP